MRGARTVVYAAIIVSGASCGSPSFSGSCVQGSVCTDWYGLDALPADVGDVCAPARGFVVSANPCPAAGRTVSCTVTENIEETVMRSVRTVVYRDNYYGTPATAVPDGGCEPTTGAPDHYDELECGGLVACTSVSASFEEY